MGTLILAGAAIFILAIAIAIVTIATAAARAKSGQLQPLAAPETNTKRDTTPRCHPASLLTPTELKFYHALKRAAGNKYTIACKVNMKDLIDFHPDDYRQHANKIDRKHIDFVLLSPGSMFTSLAIELDDHTHRRAANAARDTIKDQYLQWAGIQTIRIQASDEYDFRFLNPTPPPIPARFDPITGRTLPK